MALALFGGASALADLPREVDLRPRYAELGLSPKSQGGRGCCSLFAMVGVLEFEYGSQGEPDRLSEEYLNWASHNSNGRTSDGSFFSDGLRGLRLYGICRQSLMPYATDYDPDARPSAEALADAAGRRDVSSTWIKDWDVDTGMTQEMLLSAKRALAGGHPVAIGMRWPKQASFDESHLLAVPPPEEVFDGHSVVLVGYEDDESLAGGGSFIFRNSSGPEWQDAGYARLPYAYVGAYGNDAVCLVPGGAEPLVSNGEAEPALQFENLQQNEALLCSCSVQSMAGWGAVLWSGGRQLFCRAESGAVARFSLPVKQTAGYRLSLCATRAPDYGTVRLLLDGNPLGDLLDLYAPQVEPTGKLPLATLHLAAGEHILSVEVVGKSGSSRGYHFGLDCMVLSSAEPGTIGLR